MSLYTQTPRCLRLKLDPAKAVPGMISYQYDENADPESSYEGEPGQPKMVLPKSFAMTVGD